MRPQNAERPSEGTALSKPAELRFGVPTNTILLKSTCSQLPKAILQLLKVFSLKTIYY